MTDMDTQAPPVPANRPERGPAAPAPAPVVAAPFVHADMMELLFFAYRDFTGDADEILAQIGFGRAHHRVLHFVNRHPGMRVTDLLDILKITKQSLGRVLKQLVDGGYVVQEPGPTDRRERLLFATPRGHELARELAAPQGRRIEAALKGLDAGSVEQVRAFLRRMVNPAGRSRVAGGGGDSP